MALSGPTTAASVDALLREGKLAGHWTLDPSRSNIRLKSKSVWGLVKVNGVFGQIEGAGTVSAAGQATGTITVASASIDTKLKKRDEHLRSADLFDVANHPSITFTADEIRPSSPSSPSTPGVTVTGRLSVRGYERPVSFDAQVSSSAGSEVTLDGEVQINRADFGLTWNQLGMSSMDNTITVHAVFTRQ
jgi:polyisoprenoid-binding protein YceI